MWNSYRVVIRAFTLRRDVAASVLLARALECMGCACYVASSRNFYRALKLWKPHAVVINTVSKIEACARLAPNALLIEWPGEGSEAMPTSIAKFLSEMPGAYEKLSRVLLWGTQNEGYFYELFPNHDHDKLVLCGNPRLDLVKFNPALNNAAKGSNSVGIVGRFNNLNHHDGRPTISTLMNPIAGFDSVIAQTKAFACVVKVIRYLLEHTDYTISIRPHPLEAVESYKYVTKLAPDRFDVDDSLDVAAWMAKQRFLIGPSSTTFVEAYLLKKPTINLDRIIDSEAFTSRVQPHTLLAMKLGALPETYEEVYECLHQGPPEPERVPEIEDHIDKGHGGYLGGSAVKRAAVAIVDALDQTSFPRQPIVPLPVIDAIDEVSFRRACRANPLHVGTEYKRGYHKIPVYFDTIVKHITAA